MAAAVGVMIEGQEGLNWERWRKLCADTEELGFDSLWRSDHLFSVMGVEGRECIEAWVSLAMAAEWTRSIEFGVLVSPMTFRAPAVVARMAAAVDQLSGGRLVLGLGAGWNQVEHDRFQIELPPLRERMDRFEAGIKIIRKALDGCLPKPAREPLPILIGGSGERRTLRLVAEHADEWNTNVLEPEVYAAKVRALEEHCRQAGRDPAGIRRSVMTSFIVGRNSDELRERALAIGEVVPRYGGMEADEVLAAAGERWAVGSPSQIVEYLRTYVDLGVTRFMLQHFLMDDRDALQLLAEEVVPALR